MFERALAWVLSRLAFFEPFQKIVGRSIDQFDSLAFINHLVRNGLAHTHAGDLRHHVIQAVRLLDLTWYRHRYPRQEFFNVLVAFWMPAAFCVGVASSSTKASLGRRCNTRVQVHLSYNMAFIEGTFLGTTSKPWSEPRSPGGRGFPPLQ